MGPLNQHHKAVLLIAVPVQCSVKSTLRRLKEYNDFNDVTMAHEDGTQVRQTRSSSHHPVKIDTKVKEKSESQVEQTVEKTE